MRVRRKVADTGSKIWCQGGASECTPGYRPFQRMELGVTPMFQKSRGGRLREGWRERGMTDLVH